MQAVRGGAHDPKIPYHKSERPASRKLLGPGGRGEGVAPRVPGNYRAQVSELHEARRTRAQAAQVASTFPRRAQDCCPGCCQAQLLYQKP